MGAKKKRPSLKCIAQGFPWCNAFEGGPKELPPWWGEGLGRLFFLKKTGKVLAKGGSMFQQK